MALSITYILLLTFSLSWADDPSVITNGDKNILTGLRTTFQNRYNLEKVSNFKQFAVLYYGPGNEVDDTTLVTNECKEQADNMVFLDQVKSTFDITKCTYIAGKLRQGVVDLHTEKIIFESLKQTGGQVCPGDAEKNIYLYTHNCPCEECYNRIKDFMNLCGGGANFKRLIIGYENEFGNGYAAVIEGIKDTNRAAIIKLQSVGLIYKNLL